MSPQLLLRSLPAGFGVDLPALLGRVSRSHSLSAALLVILSLLLYLPGLASIPPVDRDEARFAQATKQMLESGNFVDIRFQDETRYKKPVGIYWLQAAAVSLTGEAAQAPIGAYRLASLAGAMLAVLLCYWAGLPLFGRQAALLAAVLLSATILLTVEAHLAKTDAVLLATVLMTMGGLARIYLGRATLLPALAFWAGLGLGILVKGPIVPMVAGLTVLALVAVERRGAWLRGLRPALGVPLVAAIVLPWFVAILALSDGDFLRQSVGADLLGKVASGQESHGAPPGTYFALFWLTFWPVTALVPLAAAAVWRRRGEPAVRFCLAWIVPSWVVFELVATKLPHYVLPLYPAIALLAAAVAIGGELAVARWWTRAMPALAAALAAALPVVALAALARFEGVLDAAALLPAALVVVLAVLAVQAGWRDRPLAAALLLVVAAVPAYWVGLGRVTPRLDTLFVSPRLAAAAERAARCPAPAVVSSGFEEPSLVFLIGTDLRFSDGAGAAGFLGEGACRVALVDAPQEASFLAAAAAAGLAVERTETVSGIGIGRAGRPVAMGIYRRKEGL